MSYKSVLQIFVLILILIILSSIYFVYFSNPKEIIKRLQIADTQFKIRQDNLKLIDISRNTLGSQLNQKLKDLPTVE